MRPQYEKIEIHGESDLPKEDGEYFMHNKKYGLGSTHFYSTNLALKFTWETEIDWYLIEVDNSTEPEISDEMTEDEIDLIQYVTNLLYGAYADGKQKVTSDLFDRWVELQMENLKAYYSQLQSQQVPEKENNNDLESCYESFIRSNHLSREWEKHYESWHNGKKKEVHPEVNAEENKLREIKIM